MNPAQRATNPFVHYGILALIYGIGMLTLLSHTVFHAAHMHSMQSFSLTSATAATDCQGQPGHSYTLNFTSHGIVPSSVIAHRCDELTLTNSTQQVVIAAIGPHERHIHYAGFTETPLSPGGHYSFRLAQVGTFPLHDHEDDSLRATLLIK